MYIKDLPIGSRIREGKSGDIFIVADHQHMGWKGTTLVAEEAVMISCIDSAEPSNPDASIAAGGNNRYIHSNIHQWLNSASDNWYTPMHEYDEIPSEDGIVMRTDVFKSALYDHDAELAGPYSYHDKPGYLSRFSKTFTDALIENNILSFGVFDPDIIHYGPPTPEKVPAKAFLLSSAEIGFEDEPRYEGFLVKLFQDARYRMCSASAEALHKAPDYVYKQSAVAYWLRSIKGGTKDQAKIFQTEHKLGDVIEIKTDVHPVNYAAGIRPAMNISDDLPLTSRDEYGIWNIE